MSNPPLDMLREITARNVAAGNVVYGITAEDTRNPGDYTCAEEKRCTNRATTTAKVDGIVVWSCGRHVSES